MYPAIEDRRSAVALVEARGPAWPKKCRGAASHAWRCWRCRNRPRYWHKRVAEDRELVLQSRGLELAQPLADAVSGRVFLDCFAPPDVPLPRNREAFSQRLDQGRAPVGGGRRPIGRDRQKRPQGMACRYAARRGRP